MDMRVVKTRDHRYYEGNLCLRDVYVEAGVHKSRFLQESKLYDPCCSYHFD